MSNFQKISDGLQLTQLPTASQPASPVNGMIYYDSTLNQFQMYQNGSWGSFSSAGVANGTAGDLALYPSTGGSVSDVYVQNTKNIKVAITSQPTRSSNITYSIPNPGDAVASADFVLTEGAQTINGNKTFGNDVIVSGDLTVNGALSYLNTTNTQIKDALITLNKGGGAASGGGSGFEIEESAAITGYIKQSAARDGFDIKASNVAGISTIRPNSTTHTYDLPNANGTLLTAVVQDTAPQLGGNLDVNGNAIQSVSNGNIPIAPNGSGRIQIAAQGALTRYVDVQYIDAITLTASSTAVASSLTFDSRTIKGQVVKYTIVESTTNKRRQGELKVVCDGASGVAASNTFITDSSIETADVGVSWSVAVNVNNIELSYTTTANNKTMQVLVERFLA